ncbi:unnamed protein product [Linum tenue]|uniref:Uncharacterized protein n=1 Tax=Linum tenue TaxID=586396 RepID=A0AAV0K0I0_9ROSI|nr:unnamed protein product [Linum tenue]
MGPDRLPVRRGRTWHVPDGGVRAEAVPGPRLHRRVGHRRVQRADGVQLGVRELRARDKVRRREHCGAVPQRAEGGGRL